MKRLYIILLLIILSTSISYSSELNNKEPLSDNTIIMDQLNNIDMNDLEKVIDNMNNQTQDYFPKLDIKSMIGSLIKGEGNYSVKDLLNGVLKVIFKETVANSTILIKLIILSIICTLLSNLSSAFESDTVSKLAYAVCYLVIIALSIKSFSTAIAIGTEAIDEMVSFIQALLPILITFLMSMGAITTAAIFQPIIFTSIGIISTLMKDMIMPMVFFSGILAIVNNLSSKIQVSKLSSLLKQSAVVLMSFILTIFSGVITIQGIAASTSDGVTLRTAKFATENFIPIVGGFISEAFDTIIGCSLLLKNTIGIIGLITLFVIVIMPLLKILSLIIIYKITAAVIEPITDSKLTNCLNEISNAMVLVFASVTCVAIMFFVAVTIIVAAGNVTLMMR
ncbi:stage III sporulation protein AE [Lutibacter sp. B2]|nr:stage III sporulation protein AE [Lutibacter sp. B2]